MNAIVVCTECRVLSLSLALWVSHQFAVLIVELVLTQISTQILYTGINRVPAGDIFIQ